MLSHLFDGMSQQQQQQQQQQQHRTSSMSAAANQEHVSSTSQAAAHQKPQVWDTFHQTLQIATAVPWTQSTTSHSSTSEAL